MPVTLTNRSRALVTLELNTGRWIHLAPGETSRPLKDYEVHDNRHIRKLAGQRVLSESRLAEAVTSHPRDPVRASRSKRTRNRRLKEK
jgi:hypothetical protein